MRAADISTIILFVEYEYERLKEFICDDSSFDLEKEADRLIHELRSLESDELSSK